MPEEVGIKIWQPQLQSMQAEGPMGPDVAAILIARDQQVDGGVPEIVDHKILEYHALSRVDELNAFASLLNVF
ncbi:hypothetical protein [Burkholderia cenocepacia]|uniref:hypothetical protein n=1 Tax=Burkholderia cenocepacia TaxID=95486 RepID=UPI0011B78871|nr:hypothetical protein [Burkholderia cenocepacia]